MSLRSYIYERPFTFGTLAFLCMISVSAWLAVVDLDKRPLDDTDDHVTGRRSNLRIYRDYGTGCQYLTVPGGGVTPRLNPDGKAICAKAGVQS